MKQPGSKDIIRIVEAGAGTGSAAESILYYFQNFVQEWFQ
jgi:SAM-dependent MidA family methyltransferase